VTAFEKHYNRSAMFILIQYNFTLSDHGLMSHTHSSLIQPALGKNPYMNKSPDIYTTNKAYLPRVYPAQPSPTPHPPNITPPHLPPNIYLQSIVLRIHPPGLPRLLPQRPAPPMQSRKHGYRDEEGDDALCGEGPCEAGRGFPGGDEELVGGEGALAGGDGRGGRAEGRGEGKG